VRPEYSRKSLLRSSYRGAEAYSDLFEEVLVDESYLASAITPVHQCREKYNEYVKNDGFVFAGLDGVFG